MYMCECVCVCVCTCVYVCMYVRVCMCVYMYVYIFVTFYTLHLERQIFKGHLRPTVGSSTTHGLVIYDPRSGRLRPTVGSSTTHGRVVLVKVFSIFTSVCPFYEQSNYRC